VRITLKKYQSSTFTYQWPQQRKYYTLPMKIKGGLHININGKPLKFIGGKAVLDKDKSAFMKQ